MRSKLNYKLCLLVLVLVLACSNLYAHTINYVLEKAPTNDVIWFYLKLGFNHIIPEGFDHILFVIGLCLLGNKLKVILWQATAFTVAHSLTLALSMKSVIVAPGEIVEPIIALSILFVAVENILISGLKPWRIILVFLFGLIHGLGFASSLNEIGLPRNKFLTSILSFNVGVELGQVAVILAVYLLLVIPFGKKEAYRKWVVYPLSALIAVIACYWTIERVFFT
ncbi:HupE/UreJ family protein [Segetibacter sp. 3557_3]|uniref:HupE/UreJ family protein n=1 Tax=Segetibacter sp. 3557_3 TaxID=2547429 RepID=UPI0010584121|nr:HupE/UreJ family protein [Segetibacter sp. 3557_3]TDH28888.1 HupE/UreJ family protein [Segetibacter sp. 3557_3]